MRPAAPPLGHKTCGGDGGGGDGERLDVCGGGRHLKVQPVGLHLRLRAVKRRGAQARVQHHIERPIGGLPRHAVVLVPRLGDGVLQGLLGDQRRVPFARRRHNRKVGGGAPKHGHVVRDARFAAAARRAARRDEHRVGAAPRRLPVIVRRVHLRRRGHVQVDLRPGLAG
eukprot:6489673-Prymnesium_polylepis.1